MLCLEVHAREKDHCNRNITSCDRRVRGVSIYKYSNLSFIEFIFSTSTVVNIENVAIGFYARGTTSLSHAAAVDNGSIVTSPKSLWLKKEPSLALIPNSAPDTLYLHRYRPYGLGVKKRGSYAQDCARAAKWLVCTISICSNQNSNFTAKDAMKQIRLDQATASTFSTASLLVQARDETLSLLSEGKSIERRILPSNHQTAHHNNLLQIVETDGAKINVCDTILATIENLVPRATKIDFKKFTTSIILHYPYWDNLWTGGIAHWFSNSSRKIS